MKIATYFVLTTALLYLHVNMGYAVEWYVSDESGSNSNDGRSEGSAFATLNTAAGVVSPGDTVHVLNGTYTNWGYGTGRYNNRPPCLKISRGGNESHGYVT